MILNSMDSMVPRYGCIWMCSNSGCQWGGIVVGYPSATYIVAACQRPPKSPQNAQFFQSLAIDLERRRKKSKVFVSKSGRFAVRHS